MIPVVQRKQPGQCDVCLLLYKVIEKHLQEAYIKGTNNSNE